MIMPGTQVGGFYWQLGLVGTIQDDLAKVKKDVDGFETSTKKGDEAVKGLSGSLKQNAREVQQVGAGIAATGSALVMAGMAADTAGGSFEGLSQPLILIGGGMTALGSATALTTTITKGFAAFQASEMITSLKAATAAIWAEHAALVALGATTGIGLAIAGLYLFYRATEDATSGTKALEKQIKNLNSELDSLKYVQTSMNEQLRGSQNEYDRLADAVKIYDEAISDATRDIERMKEIEEDLLGLSLDLEEAKLDEADAIAEWQKAAALGDAEDERRAGIAAGRARLRVQDIEDRIKAEQEEAKGLYTPEEKKGLEDDRTKVLNEQNRLQQELNEKKKQEEEIGDRIREKDFQMKLLEWSKAGKPLTQEEYTAFTGEEAPEWMKRAIEGIPKTSKLGYFDWWKQDIGDYSKPLAPLGTEIKNPLFKDIVINITGTVSDQTIRIPGPELGVKAETILAGYRR
jgi:hypothetical protein